MAHSHVDGDFCDDDSDSGSFNSNDQVGGIVGNHSLSDSECDEEMSDAENDQVMSGSESGLRKGEKAKRIYPSGFQKRKKAKNNQDESEQSSQQTTGSKGQDKREQKAVSRTPKPPQTFAIENPYPMNMNEKTLNEKSKANWTTPSNLHDITIRDTNGNQLKVENACYVKNAFAINIPNAIIAEKLGNIQTGNISGNSEAESLAASIAAILGMMLKHTNGTLKNGTALDATKKGEATNNEQNDIEMDTGERSNNDDKDEKGAIVTYLFPCYVTNKNDPTQLERVTIPMRYLGIETILATKDRKPCNIDYENIHDMKNNGELKKALNRMESVGIRVWLIVNDPHFSDSSGVEALMNANLKTRKGAKKAYGRPSQPLPSAEDLSTVEAATKDIADTGEWHQSVRNYTKFTQESVYKAIEDEYLGDLMNSFSNYKKQKKGKVHPLAPEELFDPQKTKGAALTAGLYRTSRMGQVERIEKSTIFGIQRNFMTYFPADNEDEEELCTFCIPNFLVDNGLWHVIDPRMHDPLSIPLPPDPLRSSSSPTAILSCFRELKGRDDDGLLQYRNDEPSLIRCLENYITGIAYDSATCITDQSTVRNFSKQMCQEKNGTIKREKGVSSSNLQKQMYASNLKREHMLKEWKAQAVKDLKRVSEEKDGTHFRVWDPCSEHYLYHLYELVRVYFDKLKNDKLMPLCEVSEEDDDIKRLYDALYYTGTNEDAYKNHLCNSGDNFEKREGVNFDPRAVCSSSICPIFTLLACKRAKRANVMLSAFGLPPEHTHEHTKKILGKSLDAYLSSAREAPSQITDSLKQFPHNINEDTQGDGTENHKGGLKLLDQIIDNLDEILKEFVEHLQKNIITKAGKENKKDVKEKHFKNVNETVMKECADEYKKLHVKSFQDTSNVIRTVELHAFDQYMSSAIDGVDDMIVGRAGLSDGLVKRYKKAILYLSERNASVYGEHVITSEFTCFGQAVNDIVKFSHDVMHYGFGEMEKGHFLTIYFGAFESLINGFKMGTKTFGARGNGKSEAWNQLKAAFCTKCITSITNKSSLADCNGATSYDCTACVYDEQPEWTKSQTPELQQLKCIISEGETTHQRTEERLDPQATDPSRFHTKEINTEHNEKYAINSNEPSFVTHKQESVAALWDRFQTIYFHTSEPREVKDWRKQIDDPKNKKALDHFRTTECLMTVMVVLTNCIPAMCPEMQYLDMLDKRQEDSLKRFDTKSLTTRQRTHRKNAVLLHSALHAVQVCFHMRGAFASIGLLSKPVDNVGKFDTHMFKPCVTLMKSSLTEIAAFSREYTMYGSCGNSSIHDLVQLSLANLCGINPEDHNYVPANNDSSDNGMLPMVRSDVVTEGIVSRAATDKEKDEWSNTDNTNQTFSVAKEIFIEDLKDYLEKRSGTQAFMGANNSIHLPSSLVHPYVGIRPALTHRFYTNTNRPSKELDFSKTIIEKSAAYQFAKNKIHRVLFPTLDDGRGGQQFDYGRLYLPSCHNDGEVADELLRSTFLREFQLSREFIRDVINYLKDADVMCLVRETGSVNTRLYDAKPNGHWVAADIGRATLPTKDDYEKTLRVELADKEKDDKSLESRIVDKIKNIEGSKNLMIKRMVKTVMDQYKIFPKRKCDNFFMKLTIDNDSQQAEFATFHHNMNGRFVRRPLLNWMSLNGRQCNTPQAGADPAADSSSSGSLRFHISLSPLMRTRDLIMYSSLKCASHAQINSYQDPRMNNKDMCTPMFPQMLMYGKCEQIVLDTTWPQEIADDELHDTPHYSTHYITICDNPQNHAEMLGVSIDTSKKVPLRSIFRNSLACGDVEMVKVKKDDYSEDYNATAADWQSDDYITWCIVHGKKTDKNGWGFADPFLQFCKQTLYYNSMLGYSSIDFSDPEWIRGDKDATGRTNIRTFQENQAMELLKECVNPERLRQKSRPPKLNKACGGVAAGSSAVNNCTNPENDPSLDYTSGLAA